MRHEKANFAGNRKNLRKRTRKELPPPFLPEFWHDGTYDEFAYGTALDDWRNKSSISGIFDSFSDNFVKRITYSVGAEYAYDQKFFLRGGYYYESKYAGNRQYFGLGAGFALNVIKIDASYMIATAQNSPLDQTLRFTLSFDMDGIKDLFGGN